MPRGRPKGSKNKMQETQLGAASSPQAEYVVLMTLNGVLYEKRAEALTDALDQFDWNFYKKTLDRPVVFPTMLSVRGTHGKSTEVRLTPYQLRRFFHSKIFRRITEKNLNNLWQ